MRLATLVLFTLMALPGFARADLNVVTSIKPLALLLGDLGGEHVQVTTLVPNAGSIHHYSMRVSDRMAVAKADMVVLVGAGLEPFMGKLSGIDADQMLRMDVLPGVETHGLEGNDDEHNHDSHIDPHLWLSPANSALLAKAISESLIRLMPDQRAFFEQRLTEVLASQHRLSDGVNLPDGVDYFAYHNAFTYLLHPFGITLRGVLTNVNESRVGMRSLYRIKQAVQGASKACVLVQSNAREVSEKILGQVNFAEIDVLADQHEYTSYSEYLAAMLRAIADC